MGPSLSRAGHATSNRSISGSAGGFEESLSLDSNDTEAKAALSLIYFNQGVAAYNANKYEDAIAAYRQAIGL